MARRGKQKSKAAGKEGHPPSRHPQGRQPKIVESVDDSDDEEIDEDEAFNSEDERMYGHFFKDKTIKRMKGDDSNDDEDASSKSGDEEDSTSNDDDEGASDEDDDDDDDGGQYMLDLLDKLDTAGSKKKDEDKASSAVQMAKLAESEYSSSISKKGLTLDNLMEGLQDTQGFKNLQRTFSQQQHATPAPLDKVVSDRTQRKLVYESQSKNVSRWTKVIQENRQAETLDFKPKERLDVTRDTLVDKFEPTTEFEKELEQALDEAGQKDEEAVLQAEEKALQDDLGANRLTMEEYKKRRGQLAQIRALMFYHEQKRHHIKKIKSKKYRRIRKKQRERLKESALEAAVEEDADLAQELKEKEEVSRIQERMTLAHKNTSKWAKRVLKRGKNVDIETRRALSAQLKRGDDLRRKMMGDEDKSDSDNDSDEDLVESARKVLADTDDAADPTDGKSGLFKLSFMQKGMMKQRDKARDEARRLLNELQSNEGEDMGDDVDDNSIDEQVKKKEVVASDKEMKSVMKQGELVATSLEFGNSNSISMSGGIDIDISGENGKTDNGNGGARDDSDIKNRRVGIMTEHVSTLVHDPKQAAKTNASSSATENKKAKHAKEPKPSQAPTNTTDEHEENPWLQSSKEDDTKSSNTKSAASNTKKKSSKKGIVDIEGAADILDSGIKAISFLATTKSSGDKDTNAGESGEKMLTMLSQEELIKRAFATTSEKELEDEFKREKEAMAAENDPTRKVAEEKGSKEVAGWGSWVGAGAPPPPPPRRKQLPKKLQAPLKKEDPNKRKRQDEFKPDVIINQKRLRNTANTYMLGDVPHPYSSRAEYEQSMLGGVGREWNVTGSFKNMTRPEILTRSGKIIQPISKKAKVARAPAKF